MNPNPNPQQQIQLKASDEALRGHYANIMQIFHTKEEFVLDFMLLHPPAGELQSRIITSPGHAKRILSALQENIKNYENAFGQIEESKAPERTIGFQAE